MFSNQLPPVPHPRPLNLIEGERMDNILGKKITHTHTHTKKEKKKKTGKAKTGVRE